MDAGFSSNFFKPMQQQQQAGGAGSLTQTQVKGADAAGKGQSAQGNNPLTKTSVFTAEKAGMQPQAGAQQGQLAGGNSGFSGINAYGDMDAGFGDTFSFSSTQSSSAGGFSVAMPAAAEEEDPELKELGDALGCEANEEEIKDTLENMSAEEIMELDGNLIEIAADKDLLDTKQVEQKITKENEKAKGADAKDQQAQDTQSQDAQSQDSTAAAESQAGAMSFPSFGLTQNRTQQDEGKQDEDELRKKAMQFGSLSGNDI